MAATDERRPTLKRRNGPRGSTVSIYLGPATRKRLVDFARRKSVTVSSVAEVALDRYLSSEEKIGS